MVLWHQTRSEPVRILLCQKLCFTNIYFFSSQWMTLESMQKYQGTYPWLNHELLGSMKLLMVEIPNIVQFRYEQMIVPYGLKVYTLLIWSNSIITKASLPDSHVELLSWVIFFPQIFGNIFGKCWYISFKQTHGKWFSLLESKLWKSLDSWCSHITNNL